MKKSVKKDYSKADNLEWVWGEAYPLFNNVPRKSQKTVKKRTHKAIRQQIKHKEEDYYV